MEEKKKGRNWKAKYLQRIDFQEWLDNDWKHLVDDVRLMKWQIKLLLYIGIAILVALIASIVVQ